MLLCKFFGKQISNLKAFPNKANVSFVKVVDQNTFIIRVFERGVGLTYACGSAACATFLVGKHLNHLDMHAEAQFAYGNLTMELSNNNELITKGTTTSTFHGYFRV